MRLHDGCSEATNPLFKSTASSFCEIFKRLLVIRNQRFLFSYCPFFNLPLLHKRLGLVFKILRVGDSPRHELTSMRTSSAVVITQSLSRVVAHADIELSWMEDTSEAVHMGHDSWNPSRDCDVSSAWMTNYSTNANRPIFSHMAKLFLPSIGPRSSCHYCVL